MVKLLTEDYAKWSCRGGCRGDTRWENGGSVYTCATHLEIAHKNTCHQIFYILQRLVPNLNLGPRGQYIFEEDKNFRICFRQGEGVEVPICHP